MIQSLGICQVSGFKDMNIQPILTHQWIRVVVSKKIEKILMKCLILLIQQQIVIIETRISYPNAVDLIRLLYCWIRTSGVRKIMEKFSTNKIWKNKINLLMTHQTWRILVVTANKRLLTMEDICPVQWIRRFPVKMLVVDWWCQFNKIEHRIRFIILITLLTNQIKIPDKDKVEEDFRCPNNSEISLAKYIKYYNFIQY